jgi:hypothetical protein
MNVSQLHLKALFFNEAWAYAIIARTATAKDQWQGGTPVETVPVAYEVLTDCFLWDLTSEGVGFWCEVALYIMKEGVQALCDEYATVDIAFDTFTRNGRL